MTRVEANIERWPVKGSFTIARGAKTHVDVVKCTITKNGRVGMGESTPVYYLGETAEKCVSEIHSFASRFEHFDRDTLVATMAAGAARNALDCALWDLEDRVDHLPQMKPLATAFTISLGDPSGMAVQAQSAVAKGYDVLKLKLAGSADDRIRVGTVHQGAPNARLIVDANESWAELNISEEAQALSELGVEMIEQPLPAESDGLLRSIKSPIPICADESCHTSEDVPRCADRYDAVNIKLDKAGGLTEAMRLADSAEAAGLQIMVGCMLCTSLAIKPAFALAQRARWVDLDGPILLARDREPVFRYKNGLIYPPG